MSIIAKFKLIFRLGIANVCSVYLYRFLLVIKFYSFISPIKASSDNADFFADSLSSNSTNINKPINLQGLIAKANLLCEGKIFLFSNNIFQIGSPPRWFYNPYTNKEINNLSHWSNVKELALAIGDVKVLWDTSRFNWALVFMRSYLATGNQLYLQQLNMWIKSWIQLNPLNAGVNWRCSQEVAIRAMQLFLAGHLLNQNKGMNREYISFIFSHLQRINLTTYYAEAQNNNHIVSESCALYILSSWVLMQDGIPLQDLKKLRRWQKKGLQLFERNVIKLVCDDGGFSQGSIIYHRLLLDLLWFAEYFRKCLKLPPFSKEFYAKSKLAILWLYNFVDANSGMAANIGANDGSCLFVLHELDYQDHRATLQTASILYFAENFYPITGEWNSPARWLQLEQNNFVYKSKQDSKIFPQSGFVKLVQQPNINLYLRLPQKKFRPLQADIMHVDLWCGEENILQDSGTYSYNDPSGLGNSLSSVVAHNTIQFDARDQMLKISNFLFQDWVRLVKEPVLRNSNNTVSVTAACLDYKNVYHKRSITLEDKKINIQDIARGFNQSATLRWHLLAKDWQITENVCYCDDYKIEIFANTAIRKFNLLTAYKSMYYLSKTECAVLEVEVGFQQELLFTTVISLL